jgi:hypothetical protein
MTKRRIVLLVPVLAGLALFLPAPTKVPVPKIPFDPRTYVCYRAPAPVVIDGNLDEDVWIKAPFTDNFVDIEGSLRPKPRFRTMVKMLWDDEYFYFGAYLEEPQVWATLTKRDSIIFQDNDFEVFIDPDGDTHGYYELEMNALNTVWDLFLVKPYRDGGPAIHAWDISGLKTAVKVSGTINDPADTDKAWMVEIAMPWEILKEAAQPKSAPRPGDQWRVNFSRVEYRVGAKDGAYVKSADPSSGRALPEDNWVWSPIGLVNIHYPEMWGYVQFSGKTAGQGRESFEKRPDEAAKWALRKIYYAQWAAKADKGAFSADLAALGVNAREFRIKGFVFPPSIQATAGMFEASIRGEGGETWKIRDDGRVWKEK